MSTQTLSVPAKRRRTVAFSLAATVVPALLALGTAPPAEAVIATNGAYWNTYTTCDVGYHTLTQSAEIRPQPGWSSQYVAIGSRIYDVTRGQWSPTAWAYPRVTNATTVQIGGAAYAPPGRYRVYHYIAWWTGTRYVGDTGWYEDAYAASIWNNVPQPSWTCNT